MQIFLLWQKLSSLFTSITFHFYFNRAALFLRKESLVCFCCLNHWPLFVCWIQQLLVGVIIKQMLIYIKHIGSCFHCYTSFKRAYPKLFNLFNLRNSFLKYCAKIFFDPDNDLHKNNRLRGRRRSSVVCIM